MTKTAIVLSMLLLGCTGSEGAAPLRRGPAPLQHPAADATDALAPDARRPDSSPDTSTPPDSVPDATPDATSIAPDTAPDLTIDLPRDLLAEGSATDAYVPPIDTSPDLTRDSTIPDLPRDLATPDSAPRKSLGTSCGNPDQCSSGYCTNGVCCSVALCYDTCVPSAINSCPVYNGWTCAPSGTCRAY